MTKITEPGIYDMPADDYHADPCPAPSLSAGGAIRLRQVSALQFHYEQSQPYAPTDAFDVGHYAHALLLGDGMELAAIDAPDWRKKATKAQRDEARAAGKTPLLVDQAALVEGMVAALRAHPFAGCAFTNGEPEKSVFWIDRDLDIWCRARPDWLPAAGNIWPDYKTAASVHPDDLQRQIVNMGYYQRAAWYIDAIRAAGLHDNPAYVMVFQQKPPPHEIVVVQPTADAVAWGRMHNRAAMEMFASCLAADRWPGYADDVMHLGLPGWAEKAFEAEGPTPAYSNAVAAQAPAAE